jgi:cystinosin
MTDNELEAFANAISRVLGWMYFLSWYVLTSESNAPSVDSHAYFSRRSASFYPQPISNYWRKSTVGLAIDFPTLNVLGFWCYTLSTACFLYSPIIRSQYAYRHPEAPETTVRFNDFLFAAHGAALTVIIYSQFFPQIWGFTIGRTQRVSRAVLGIWWGLVIGVIIVAFVAKFFGMNGGYDASGWAWIDVVSTLQSSRAAVV